jgi:monoamine oxidase
MLEGNSLLLNSLVESVDYNGSDINVTVKQTTEQSSSAEGDATLCQDDSPEKVIQVRARAVVVAAPPRVVATTIQFSPSLGEQLNSLLIGM